ncbi:MAG: serine hydrolase [Gemmataceae bacterium]
MEGGLGCPPLRDEELLTVGDGGVWTNLDDLVRWDAALRGDKLLKPATWKLALTPSKTRDGKTNAYGCGWSLGLDDAGAVTDYGHGGNWNGFRTVIDRSIPADRLIVVLSNRGNFDADSFVEATIMALAKGRP